MSIAVVSCKRPYEFDSDAALRWSETSDVQQREIAASYSFMRKDSTWIIVTTAQMEESENDLTYAGGEILNSGYLVYPGGIKVSNIKEAVEICLRTQGGQLAAASKNRPSEQGSAHQSTTAP